MLKDRNADRLICEQTKVLCELLCAIKDEAKWWRSTRGLATKEDLKNTEERIMSAIIESAGRVKTFLEAIGTSVDGLTTDVRNLQAAIDKLQSSPGAITPADQASLNEIEQIVEAMAVKVKAADDINAPL